MNPIRFIKKYFLKIDDIQCALGRIELRQLDQLGIKKINESEFKVFSQWGEDGIIQYLINKIPITQKIFIEFGVEDYLEANTRFLLINNNWSGLIFDGSMANINFIKKQSIYWRYDITAKCAFITADNINQHIIDNNIKGDIGLLSIDVDGNDYWIWKNIEIISPRIVVIEYNNIFGPDLKITIPYEENFVRSKAHYSNIYFGASLAALNSLAESNGYSLVGSNSTGCNAFFVRNDVIGDLVPVSPRECFSLAKYHESRNIRGRLSFLNRSESISLIKDMPVLDLESNLIVKIKDLDLGKVN